MWGGGGGGGGGGGREKIHKLLLHKRKEWKTNFIFMQNDLVSILNLA